MVYTATDREQIEQLKRWWNDYGRAIVIAVLIGLLIGAGWRYWHAYVANQREAASQIYQSMLQASLGKQSGVVAQYAAQLQDQYKHTVYATLGSFVAAEQAVTQQEYAAADRQLTWVVQHGSNPAFQQIARIRDARLWLQMNKPSKALQVLATENASVYQPMIDEVKAMSYSAEGQPALSASYFQKAKLGYQLAGISNPLVDLRAH